MDFNFEHLLKGSQQLLEKQNLRREAQTVADQTGRMVERSAADLMQQAVHLHYKHDDVLHGHKVVRARDGNWLFERYSIGPQFMFVTGLEIDDLHGAYLVGFQPGRAGEWRIFIDGLSGIQILDMVIVGDLQPQPG